MGCCYCVDETQVGVVERFGKYNRVLYPGCSSLNPCTETVIGSLSLKVIQHNVEIETRTKDNVFVTIKLAVRVKVAETEDEFPKPRQVQRLKKKETKTSSKHNKTKSKGGDVDESKKKPINTPEKSDHVKLEDVYDDTQDDDELEMLVSPSEPDPIVRHGKPNPDLIYHAYYKLNDPISQIKTFIEQYYRFHGMEYSLDNMFAAKDELVVELLNELNKKVNSFGYVVYDVFVKDITPSDPKVRAAMNEVVASEKAKIAITNRAQAQKQAKILSAEAEAKTRELEGAGVAAARRAIIGGLRTSVDDFQKDIPDAEPRDLLLTVLMTQYLDTLKEAASKGRNNFVLPSSPGQLGAFEDQMRSAILTSARVEHNDPQGQPYQ